MLLNERTKYNVVSVFNFRKKLNVGTVPTVKMYPVGTVHTVKMHPVGNPPKMFPYTNQTQVRLGLFRAHGFFAIGRESQG